MKHLHLPFRIDRDQWGEILDSLTRNKTRSFLTAFGIFWGIFMLVLLMGGGKGLQSMLAENFAGFASNSGFMGTNLTSEPYKGFRKGRWWRLETADVERVRNAVPEVDIITPSNANWGSTAVNNNKTMNVTVKGIWPDYQLIEDPKVKEGRKLNEMDLRLHRKVCLIGSRIAEELYPDSVSPCGQYIQVDGIYYHIVGISGRDGNSISVQGNPQKSVIIPFTTMQQAYNKGKNVDLLCFTARPGFSITEVQDKVETVIKRAHFIHPDDSQAVITANAEAIFSMVDNLFAGVSILVWMIGLGTLISGAIGVSNIMMVTVKERTTEIGIRRAIGATPRDILTQIMSESIVLTLLAGLSGISFAVLILQLLEESVHESSPDAQFQITFGIAVGAALLLATLGIVAGLAPAFRAMSIKPVDAMRDE